MANLLGAKMDGANLSRSDLRDIKASGISLRFDEAGKTLFEACFSDELNVRLCKFERKRFKRGSFERGEVRRR